MVAAAASAADGKAPSPSPKPAFKDPIIQSVVNAATGQPGFASGTWVTIYGQDMAGTAQSVQAWGPSDFQFGLPVNLQSIYVETAGGRKMYVSYISPTQINVMVPDFPDVGTTYVQGFDETLEGNIFYVNKTAYSPGLFTFTSKYPAAVHLDGSYIGPASIVQGVTTTPAKSGEIVVLFGTGFGQTNPPTDYSQLIKTPYPVAATVTATVGGQNAQVVSYLVMPGVYQFNITLPQLAPGDWPVTLAVAGQPTQTGMNITIGQ